ncbi:hypothetical protein Tco_0196218 [Tanacetum coccineum]
MTLLSFSLDIGADFVVNDAGTCGTSSAHCWDTCTLVPVTRRVNIARPTSGQWIPHNYVLHSTPVDFESLNLVLLMSELHLQPLPPRHRDIGRIKS